MYCFDVSYFIDGVGLGLKCKINEKVTGTSCCNEVNVKVVEEVEMNDVRACLTGSVSSACVGYAQPPNPSSMAACMQCSCVLFIQYMYMYAACVCMSCQLNFRMFNKLVNTVLI